jgi:hypothetical protein
MIIGNLLHQFHGNLTLSLAIVAEKLDMVRRRLAQAAQDDALFLNQDGFGHGNIPPIDLSISRPIRPHRRLSERHNEALATGYLNEGTAVILFKLALSNRNRFDATIGAGRHSP